MHELLVLNGVGGHKVPSTCPAPPYSKAHDLISNANWAHSTAADTFLLVLLLVLLLLLHRLLPGSGDHLEVLPRNSPALVDAALQLLQLTGNEAFWWAPSRQGAARGLTSMHPTVNPSSSNSSSNGTAAAAGSASEPAVLRLPLSSRDVLAWLLDLSAVPAMRVVAMLAAECPCPPEAAQLRQMASEAGYKDKVRYKQHRHCILFFRICMAAECPCPPEAAQLRHMASEAGCKAKVSSKNTLCYAALVFPRPCPPEVALLRHMATKAGYKHKVRGFSETVACSAACFLKLTAPAHLRQCS
jgi:hypothetical protein